MKNIKNDVDWETGYEAVVKDAEGKNSTIKYFQVVMSNDLE